MNANDTPVDPVRFAQLAEHVDRARADLTALALDIHAHPELAFDEHRTVGLLTERLAAAGFTVTRPLGGLDTAFRASRTFGLGGPRVALLAEYDALPELGHACGHNLIASAAVGAALAAAAALDAAGSDGVLEVIGCPAEEGGGGKVLLLDAGAFDGVDAALMFHPSHRTMPVRGALAATRLTFTWHGKAAHASTNPHLGINALEACLLTFQAINALRQHFPDEHRVHGIITDGGSAPNVVPERAQAKFLVRHRKLAQVEALRDQVVRCAEAGALAVGARLEVEQGITYAERENNLPMAERFAAYLTAQGVALDPPPTVGGVGSSDFGNLSQALPAIHAYVKIAPEGTSNHTHAFAAAAASEAGIAGMIAAAKALAGTAADLLLEPDLLAAAKAAFARRPSGGRVDPADPP